MARVIFICRICSKARSTEEKVYKNGIRIPLCKACKHQIGG